MTINFSLKMFFIRRYNVTWTPKKSAHLSAFYIWVKSNNHLSKPVLLEKLLPQVSSEKKINLYNKKTLLRKYYLESKTYSNETSSSLL